MMRALLEISDHADLHSADDVLMYIAKKKVKDSFKANLADFYRHYAEFYGISLARVRYRRDHRVPRVPLEEKIDMLIAHASRKYALIYSIIKECGLRPVEVAGLSLDDIDLEKGVLSIRSAKHGSPRALKLKEKTLAMLNSYVKTGSFGLNDKLLQRIRRIKHDGKRNIVQPLAQTEKNGIRQESDQQKANPWTSAT